VSTSIVDTGYDKYTDSIIYNHLYKVVVSSELIYHEEDYALLY